MVNHGPSKGCSTCRKRRVKCDEARPSCRECLRLGRVCEGYELEKKTAGRGIRFKDQGTALTTARRRLPPTSRSTRNPRISTTPPEWTPAPEWTSQAIIRIPATPTPSDEPPAISFFLTSIAHLGRSIHSTQGFLEPLFPVVTKEHPNSVLSTVLTAVSTKLWSMWKIPTTPTNNYQTPHPPFTKALRRLRAALNDPLERGKDSTVLSAILMHFYESLAARSMHQRTMRFHQDGARALLEQHPGAAGRSVPDSECRAYLRGYLRHCDVSTYMEEQPEDTSSLDVWFDAGAGWDDSMPAAANPNAVLDMIGLSIAGLQRRLSVLMSGLGKDNNSLDDDLALDVASWWRDALGVDARLLDWVQLVPVSCQPCTKPEEDDTVAYHGVCDIYPTVQIATIWNVWRVCRLMVLRMQLSLLAKLPPEALISIAGTKECSNSFTNPNHGRELVDAICRSMPFYLGNRQHHGGMHDLADPAIKFPSYHDQFLDEAGDQTMSPLDYKRHLLVQGPSHALLHLNSLINVLSKEGGEGICRGLRGGQVVWIREQYRRVCRLTNPVSRNS